MHQQVCLITGGCGFVGRHLVARLAARHRNLFIVDDLSTGQHPALWLAGYDRSRNGELELFANGDTTVQFLKANAIDFFWRELRGERLLTAEAVPEVYHLASIVGGRSVIDGDPLLVATDLAIDALFFRWAAKHRDLIGRILYASSSAAYPIGLQQSEGPQDSIALREDLISFQDNIGQPDMTYGWSKLTGEYLATLAAARYGMRIACVRPFSGYGEDQDLSYPVPAIAYRAAGRERPLTVWGTGRQARDFVYIEDCIDAMLLVLEKVTDGRGVNIGSGRLTSFIEVAQMFARLEGYETPVKPLIDAPVGVQSRYCDPTRIHALGWRASTSLEDGFGRVLEMAHRRRAATAA